MTYGDERGPRFKDKHICTYVPYVICIRTRGAFSNRNIPVIFHSQNLSASRVCVCMCARVRVRVIISGLHAASRAVFLGEAVNNPVT